MVGLHGWAYWLLICAGLLAVAIFQTYVSRRERRLDDEPSPVWSWLLERLSPVPEVDPAAAEMWQIVRREQLRDDVRRLQRILARDVTMSATRQIGNRLAYAWLVRELESIRERTQALPAGGSVRYPAAPPTGAGVDVLVETAAVVRGYGSTPDPTVEILDFGTGSRRRR